METSVKCYLVRATVTPAFAGRSRLENYFIAKSDRDAIQDSFCHAEAITRVYGLRVEKIEVFSCHLGMMLEGVSQGGIDCLLYDSDNLADGIIQERPDFIG